MKKTIALLLVLVMVLAMTGCVSEMAIRGDWDAGSGVTYTFDKDGKGTVKAKVLVDISVDFTWSLEKDIISITMEKEILGMKAGGTSQYKVSIDKDVMTFSDTKANEDGSYDAIMSMTKIAK
ncbi:MAG: DUF5640 domain-containing protein [Lachnospiraceae bacterium]|nr:DUF5640 domain-containing protein [Lachnospiraceae bacterium]